MKANKLIRGLAAATAMALALVMVPSSVAKADGTYTVEKNDCLSTISKKLTGTEKFWRDIYNANSSVVKSDYIIYTGQQLIIPDSVIAAAPVIDEGTADPTDSVSMPDDMTAESTDVTAESTDVTAEATDVTAEATDVTAESTDVTTEGKSALDYNEIAQWVSWGCANEDGSKLIAFNGDFGYIDYALIIWDNTSFMGPIVYNDSQIAINDEATGLPWDISWCIVDNKLLVELGDDSSLLAEKPLPELLNTIKAHIEN